MESGGRRGGVKSKAEKLTLDDYIFFFDSNKLSDLTVDHLNQIINLHGFKKVHKVPKSTLYEVVNSMDLMNPCRSTLKGNQVSSYAVLSLDEVTKGLNDLGWQECCVTSMQMLNSVDIEVDQLNLNALNNNSSNNALVTTASGSSTKVKQTKRRRRRTKKMRLSDVQSNFASNENNNAAAAAADMNSVHVDPSHGPVSYGLQSASNSSNCHGAKKLAPRRKRNVGILHDTNTNVL